MSETGNDFKPDWAIHPGQVLEEHMEFQGLYAEDVAHIAGISVEYVKEVLKGRAAVSDAAANGFELATGLKSEIWIGIQKHWDEHYAKAMIDPAQDDDAECEFRPGENSSGSYALGIEAMRVRRELLIAAKEAAVMMAEIAKAANVSPRGPGFDRLMAAIKQFEAFEAKHYGT